MPEKMKIKGVQRRVKTPQQALSSLMRYAAKAERCSGDAMRLMRGWGIGEEDARNILDRLRKDRFIDDERFAQAYVRDKSRFAGWGIYKIRAGLAAKGISGETSARALELLGEDYPHQDRLSEILQRKRRSLKISDPYEVRTKLIRFGLSRGFEYDDIMAVVSRLTSGEDMTESD